jgi:hypothetical protein
MNRTCPFCKTLMNRVVEEDGSPTRVWLDVQTVKLMQQGLPRVFGPHADLGIYLCGGCSFFAMFLDMEKENADRVSVSWGKATP